MIRLPRSPGRFTRHRPAGPLGFNAFFGTLLALFFALGVHGAINPPAEHPPLTAREVQQGFRDRVLLARPHPARQASADAEEAREGVRIREKFPRFRDLRVIEVEPLETTASALARLEATGRYEFVEPDYLRHIAAEPNDPQFTNGGLWAMKNTGQTLGVAGADISATAAWDLIREAPNVIVAVIDTGVNLAHQDLVGNLWQNPSPTFGDVNGARFVNGSQSGNPTDDNGHGTHIAGTIGAVGNNSLAVAGIAWKVQIMAVKIFPASGTGSVSDIARGVNYAVARGAHIINASYGVNGSTGFSNTERAAIMAARQAGIIFVAAAGNNGANMDLTRFYPANHALDNIITVGNSTRRDELSLTSNYGSAVDIFAPGTDIISLSHTSNTGTALLSGTSMAAPHVTGALALLKAHFPNDNYRQLINRVMRGATLGERFASKAQTNGRLNLLAALNTQTNRPFNDDFSARPRLTNDNLVLRTSNAGATPEAGETTPAGSIAAASLWWEWTAPASGRVAVETSGSAYDTTLAIYTGTAVNALTLVASNDDDVGGVQTSRLSFNAQAGSTYQIAVDGKNGASGLTLVRLGTTPANDAFATPVVLTGESTHVTGTNAQSSREAGEPLILGFSGGTSLWYRWTALRSGRFQVAAFSRDFDPLLAVYTGSTLGSLGLVSASDNTGADNSQTGSLCTVNAVEGVTYVITVDAKSAATIGQFTLSLTDSLWQATLGGAVTGASAVGRDGTLYVGGIDGAFYAFTPDGAQKWSFSAAGFIDTCSAAIADDGTIYIGSSGGTIYALNQDGTTKWTHPFGTAIAASNSPALGVDGTVYIKAGDGFLYALAPTTGATKWRRDLRAPTTYASPSVAPDGTIYQGSDDGNLYALNPADGSIKWTFDTAEDVYAVPAIDHAGNIYLSVLNNGKLFSISPAGALRWSYAGASLGSSSSPALSADGRTVYFGGYDKKLHAVDTATGAARWTYELPAEMRASSPAVDANGVVYIGCYDFKLYAINANGTLKRSYATGDIIRSSPAIFGETLYIGSNDQKLYAFNIGASSAYGPWPQYRHNARRIGRAVQDVFAFTLNPQSQDAVPGQALTLSVAVTGEGPLTYQWKQDGVTLTGATHPILTLANITSAGAGSYTVTVTGPQGTLQSLPAIVTVEALNPGRLTNLSIRTSAGVDAETLTVGFVVSGSPKKRLLIRGIGPTLTLFEVSNPLLDPQLRLLTETNVLANNDNWGGLKSVSDVFVQVGAFELTPASKDAVVIADVDARSYTAQITGVGGMTGIVLAELYDTDPTRPETTATVSRLINVSARAQVNTGSGVLIAGFTLSGNRPKTVLIRGIGPGLEPFDIPTRLLDPKLELYRGTTKIDENNHWGGGPVLTSTFDKVGAFPLAPTSLDAALVVILPPGSYTAQLTGVNATTGVALIEIYEVP